MRIWYRIWLEPGGMALAREALKDPERVHSIVEDGSGFVDVAEDDASLALIASNPGVRLIDLTGTSFEEEQIRSAEYCLLVLEHEVRMPKRCGLNDGTSKGRFDAECRHCWERARPFVISAEGRIGQNAIFAFWGGFEFLCLKEVADELEDAGFSGFNVWPVMLESGDPAPNWREIVPYVESEPAFASNRAGEILDNYLLAEDEQHDPSNAVTARASLMSRPWECRKCQRPILHQWLLGPFPLRRVALDPVSDLQYLYEYMNPGRRKIIATRRIVRFILDKGWQGASFYPIELT